jgi:membrane protein DedA with SNARE-associated domain
MDGSLITRLMDLAQSHPGWLFAAAAAFAYFESLAIIGLLLPGVLMLFLVGAVVSGQPELFLWCWLSAFLGALGGDLTSYWVGRHYRDRIDQWWLLRRHPELLASGRRVVARHGGKGVFVGRLLGPTRPVTALAAGAMNLPPRIMLAAAIPACAIWVPLYMLPGLVFGASLELAAEFAGRLAVVLVILVLGIWLVAWLTRLVYNFTARRSGWWLRSLIRWSSEHRLIGRWVEPLFGAGPGRRELLSVALLGLFLVLCLAILIGVMAALPFAAGTLDAERQLASMAASLRNHLADPVMIALALAAELEVMALVAGTTGLLMLALGRGNAAAHWLAATAGGWLLAETLNGLSGLMISESGVVPGYGELPHRGLTLVTAVLGFFAVMVAKDIRASRRKWPYLLNTVLLALISFACFYLGLVTPLGLMAALALGGGWSALVGIGYRQRAAGRHHPGLISAVFYGLLVAVVAFQAGDGYRQLEDRTRLTLPERSLPAGAWFDQAWQTLPDRRSRLGPESLQHFDFQLAGRREPLVASLEAAGWRQPRQHATSWSAIFSGRPDGRGLPHLPRDFAGHGEALIMVRDREVGQREVLRLWASGTHLVDRGVPVWLGQVRIEEVAEWFGLVNRWREVGVASDVLGKLAAALPIPEARRVDGELWLFSLVPVPAPAD